MRKAILSVGLTEFIFQEIHVLKNKLELKWGLFFLNHSRMLQRTLSDTAFNIQCLKCSVFIA